MWLIGCDVKQWISLACLVAADKIHSFTEFASQSCLSSKLTTGRKVLSLLTRERVVPGNWSELQLAKMSSSYSVVCWDFMGPKNNIIYARDVVKIRSPNGLLHHSLRISRLPHWVTGSPGKSLTTSHKGKQPTSRPWADQNVPSLQAGRATRMRAEKGLRKVNSFSQFPLPGKLFFFP